MSYLLSDRQETDDSLAFVTSPGPQKIILVIYNSRAVRVHSAINRQRFILLFSLRFKALELYWATF